MKMVTAIIKPHVLEAVTEALHGIGQDGITITEVRGHGRQRGHTETFRGSEYRVDYLPKIRVDVVTGDETANDVAHAIVGAANSGKIGDGKVWITGVDTIIRVRTGEIDADAI
jgi:nitrogen regulatory protein P-II 1